MQGFLDLGIKPVITAMQKLAGVTEAAASKLPGAKAGKPPEPESEGWLRKALGLKSAAPATGGAAAATGAMAPILDLIGKGESKGNYNALVYGNKGANTPADANLTGMTIAEVQQYQKGMIGRGHASTAVGKYQMIADTLADQVKKSGLDPTTTKFDQKTQDLLAAQLVNQAGFGKQSNEAVMKNLAGTWASLPKDRSGAGAYDGYNANQASIDPNAVLSALEQSKANLDKTKPSGADGMIATGPTSGYNALLHGTEAVVPLPNGKSIPVDIKNNSFTSGMNALFTTITNNKNLASSQPTFNSALPAQQFADETTAAAGGSATQVLTRIEQLLQQNNTATGGGVAGSNDSNGILAAQLSKLDDLIRVMQNQNSISQKILQYTQ
jgi:hypothetical protein